MTSSKVLQAPFVIVHLKMYVPYNDAVAVEIGLAELLKVIVPGPEILVQSPEPADAAFPARLATSVPQSVWSGPAFAASA